jgi:hypothetical protein
MVHTSSRSDAWPAAAAVNRPKRRASPPPSTPTSDSVKPNGSEGSMVTRTAIPPAPARSGVQIGNVAAGAPLGRTRGERGPAARARPRVTGGAGLFAPGSSGAAVDVGMRSDWPIATWRRGAFAVMRATLGGAASERDGIHGLAQRGCDPGKPRRRQAPIRLARGQNHRGTPPLRPGPRRCRPPPPDRGARPRRRRRRASSTGRTIRNERRPPAWRRGAIRA